MEGARLYNTRGRSGREGEAMSQDTSGSGLHFPHHAAIMVNHAEAVYSLSTRDKSGSLSAAPPTEVSRQSKPPRG